MSTAPSSAAADHHPVKVEARPAEVLFVKAAKNEVENPARLPNKFTLSAPDVQGNYSVSPDGQFLVLKPYSGKAFAIPLRNVQTYVETDPRPVNPLAAK